MLFGDISDEIKLYQFHVSPYCGKVRAVLRYKNIPYTVQPVHPVDRRQLLWVSRQRRVPVLTHGPRAIVDSTAIVRYLEDIVPLPSVYPRGRRSRAQALLWEDWADESLQRVIGPLKFLDRENARQVAGREARYSSPAAGKAMWRMRPVIAVQMSMFGQTASRRKLKLRLRELITLLSDRMEGLYLVGDRPSVADFSVYAVLEAFEDLNGWSVIEEFDNVLAWYRRVQNTALGKDPQRMPERLH